MWGQIISVSIVIAIIVLSVIFQMTTPSTAGPLGILLVFILAYVLAVGVLTFLLFGFSRLNVKILQFFNSKKSRRPLNLMRAYYFSSVLALGPVLLIGMQSVGEAGIYDTLLVALFIIVACFYIAKRTA